MADELLYLEDIEAGMTWDCGSETAEKDEMIAFAEKYDPQPLYIDEAAAEESMFGELIASGFFSIGIAMRLAVTEVLADLAAESLHSMEDMQWHNPVYPGDTLSVAVELLDVEHSDTWPDRGHARAAIRMVNQHRQPILTMVGKVLIEERSAD